MRLIAILISLVSTFAQAQEFSTPGWSWIEASRTYSLDDALRQAQGFRLEFPQVAVMQSGATYAVAVAIVRDTIVQREADALTRDRRLLQAAINKGDSYTRQLYGANPFQLDVQYSQGFPRAEPTTAKAPYIQIASRLSLAQAADVVFSSREQGLDPAIILLRSGWFAIVLPPSSRNPTLLLTLKREKKVPSDSALVAGQNFNETIYSPSAPNDARLRAALPDLYFKSPQEALSAGNGAAALSLLRSQFRRTGKTDYLLAWRILSEGTAGVRRDAEAAVYWLSICASQREQACMLRFGEALLRGDGLPKDPRRASELFRDLASSGHAAGQYRLASMLILGDGALQDFPEAVRLLRLSAGAGFADAQSLLGTAYKSGFTIPKDAARAYFWLSLAAANLTTESSRASAVRDRDLVADILDSALLIDVQRTTREWKVGDPEPVFERAGKVADGSYSADASPKEPRSKETSAKSGSGFFVSKVGHVVTNAHVVNGCSDYKVTTSGHLEASASLVAKDEKNDLAVLSLHGDAPSIAGLRAGAKMGEGVAVFGFPLNGVLSSNGNFTVGNVVALTGLGDDTRHLQISAPVQPGNSGGPLLDYSGAVVGVVVAKADALLFARVIKDIPQNVNFAVKTTQLMTFLDANNIPYESVGAGASSAPDALAEKARAYSVLVKCH